MSPTPVMDILPRGTGSCVGCGRLTGLGRRATSFPFFSCRPRFTDRVVDVRFQCTASFPFFSCRPRFYGSGRRCPVSSALRLFRFPLVVFGLRCTYPDSSVVSMGIRPASVNMRNSVLAPVPVGGVHSAGPRAPSGYLPLALIHAYISSHSGLPVSSMSESDRRWDFLIMVQRHSFYGPVVACGVCLCILCPERQKFCTTAVSPFLQSRRMLETPGCRLWFAC